jgi:uncharacterized membrane protein
MCREMFPFDRPTNYGEMLNKIGFFTFLTGVALALAVSNFSPAVKGVLGSSHTEVELLSIKIPLGYVIPAALFALIARIVRLHDRISDLFGIREKFDLRRILVPLCQKLGVRVDEPLISEFRARRGPVMGRFFYRYASFEDPQISKALVLGAIDLWTWYWILLEMICLLMISAVVLSFVGVPWFAATMYAATIAGILLFLTYDRFCGKRAEEQVEEILSDPARAAAIQEELLRIRANV